MTTDTDFLSHLVILMAKGRDGAEEVKAFCAENGGLYLTLKRTTSIAADLQAKLNTRNIRAAKKTAATRLPDDFPDRRAKDAAIAYWRKCDPPRPDLIATVDAEALAFREREADSKQLDWSRKWRTCYVNAPRFNRKPAETGGAPVAKFVAIHEWVERLRFHDGQDGFPAGYWQTAWGRIEDVPQAARAAFETRFGKIRA